MKTSLLSEKIIIFSCFILLSFNISYGQKALPVYEGINYTFGTLVYDNTNWWCLNSTPVNDVLVGASSLTYNGLRESIGKKLRFSGDGDDIVIWFGNQPPGTNVFYSFIFQITNMTGISNETPCHFAGFTNSYTGAGSFGCSILIQKDAVDENKFNIGHATRTSLPPVWNSEEGVPFQYSLNTPIFIVASYEIIGTFSSGTPDDKSSFWINPPVTTFEDAVPPTPNLTGNLTGFPTNDINPVNSFYLRQDAVSNTPLIEIDEIRIGLTWASVTPRSIPTGIGDIINDKEGSVLYPNPVGDILKVEVINSSVSFIEVYSSGGLRILTRKVVPGITDVDVSSFPHGVYIVSFKGPGGIYNRKFIKK